MGNTTIQPIEIDVSQPFLGAFDDTLVCFIARDLVEFAQHQQNQGKMPWEAFTKEEIDSYFNRTFFFVGMLNFYILEDKENKGFLTYSEKFIETVSSFKKML